MVFAHKKSLEKLNLLKISLSYTKLKFPIKENTKINLF